MTLAVYAPGRDSTPSDQELLAGANAVAYQPTRRRETGGVFAQYLQGMTPKYAFNDGPRADLYRNTMARMLVRVDAHEREQIFLPSIADAHTRTQLAPLLTGDPTSRNPTDTSQRRRADRNERARTAAAAGSGYLDFFIQQAQHTFTEKYQVSETLGDNYVAYFFGQSAPIFQYSGMLLNTVQDDQATNFYRLYIEILRGTQLARRQKLVSLSYDSYVVTGAMVNLQLSIAAAGEMQVPVSFQLLVRQVAIVNYTRGWQPLRAGTAFVSDLNAIPFDGRPRADVRAHADSARAPANADASPGLPAAASTDPRTQQTPPPPNTGTGTGNATPASAPPTALSGPLRGQSIALAGAPTADETTLAQLTRLRSQQAERPETTPVSSVRTNADGTQTFVGQTLDIGGGTSNVPPRRTGSVR